MNQSVLTVVGKDRVGIVYDVSKILAEHRISIINISQQLMEGFFTMILLLDMAACELSHEDMAALMQAQGERLGLDIRLQNEAIFNAMHRV